MMLRACKTRLWLNGRNDRGSERMKRLMMDGWIGRKVMGYLSGFERDLIE